MTQLPGLAMRALLRLLHGLLTPLLRGLWRWCARPANRRLLKILPLVLVAHGLLIWLLIQNRWIVMSNTTVTLMPPIMASILLSDDAADAQSTSAKPGPWGHEQAADELSLKPDLDLSFGAPHVTRSVPWLNTELLPDLRGNSRDARARRDQRHSGTARTSRVQKPHRAAHHARSRPRSAAQPQAQVLLKIPPPPPEPEVLRIPPPPETAQFPPLPASQPRAAPTPAADIPPIPEPADQTAQQIPPLWQNHPGAPPTLVKIDPPPPQLKLIPVPPPESAVAPRTASSAAPAPVPQPAPQPEVPPQVREHPRALAPPSPPAEPPATPLPAATTVMQAQTAPKPPEPPAQTPEPPAAPPTPLSLTPATALPVPTTGSPLASTVIINPPPRTNANDSASNSTSSNATTATAPQYDPMVVEVPHYREADSNAAAAAPGAGSNGSANAGTGNSGARSGPDGAGSKDGSVLGLGAAAPLPLPHASEPKRGQAKPLNLTLPRVDMFRHPEREMSLSEMTNAQLRRGDARTPLAVGIDAAENPDCLAPQGKDQAANGLLAAPVTAYKALTGKCK